MTDDEADAFDEAFISDHHAGVVDPSHLRALAKRISRLAKLIDAQIEEGRLKDGRIDRAHADVATVRNDVAKLDSLVDGLIRAEMTPEDRKSMKALIRKSDFKDDLWKVVLRYAGYGAAVAGFFYMFRDPISAFIRAFAKAVS